MNRIKVKYGKYSVSYIQYIFSVSHGLLHCVMCCEVLSAESMKPTKLIWYLHAKRLSLKHKPVELFQRKLKELNDKKKKKKQFLKKRELINPRL